MLFNMKRNAEPPRTGVLRKVLVASTATAALVIGTQGAALADEPAPTPSPTPGASPMPPGGYPPPCEDCPVPEPIAWCESTEEAMWWAAGAATVAGVVSRNPYIGMAAGVLWIAEGVCLD